MQFWDDFGLICAGYYSYLYAKCFAATIWKKLCQEDPLSLTAGTALRTKVLQHGGSKEPAELLNDLVGEGILKHCDGGIVPDITCFLEESRLVVGRRWVGAIVLVTNQNKSQGKHGKRIVVYGRYKMLCHVEDDRARNGRVIATNQSPEVVKVSLSWQSCWIWEK